MAICPECGYAAVDAAKFCPMCGTPIQTPDEGTTEPVKPVYAAPVVPKPKKKRKWWISLIVVGAVLLTALLAALGYGVYRFVTGGLNDPNLGTYTGVSATMFDMEVNVTEVLPGGFSVELIPMGGCVVTSGANMGIGKWSEEDGVLTIYDGSSTITGTLENGTMRLNDVIGTGVSILLLRDAEDGDAPIIAADDEGIFIDSGWWSDDWFGWWTISSGEGYFDGWDGSAWDCCAEITVDGSGNGHLLLWDEDTPKDEPLMEFDVTVTGGSGEMGAAVSGDGYFMDMPLEPGEITVDPEILAYGDLICIEGWYESGDDSFYYEMYLRPWGNRWEDMASEDENNLPFYFERYLSALENGEDMPEDFQTEWADAIAEYKEKTEE